MKTLLEQINEAKYEISQREHAIAAWKITLKDLEEQRVHCQHEWDNGVPGCEHEGHTVRNMESMISMLLRLKG